MKGEVAPRTTRLVMEEEIDIQRNIRDHDEREKSFQNDGDNNEQQERGNIDNNRRRCVRRRLFSDDSDNDPQERENINNRLLEERRIQLKEAEMKWDFDFGRGKPVVGRPVRYEWLQLDNQGNEISRENKE